MSQFFNFSSQPQKTMRDVTPGIEKGMQKYLQYVFANMGKALLVSGIVSFIFANTPALMRLVFGTPLSFVFMFLPLILAITFSYKIQSMSLRASQMLFYGFAAAMGVSLSSILLIYTATSITSTFAVAASMFGGMAFYGFVTKKDLTGIGSFLMMGLWGIIIASIINIFMRSSGMSFIISILGVVIFTGLTAYDTQRIKEMYYASASMDASSAKKVALMGSLRLYMDFINLFIMLLRLFGERR